jgi:hypothetical protein
VPADTFRRFAAAQALTFWQEERWLPVRYAALLVRLAQELQASR